MPGVGEEFREIGCGSLVDEAGVEYAPVGGGGGRGKVMFEEAENKLVVEGDPNGVVEETGEGAAAVVWLIRLLSKIAGDGALYAVVVQSKPI